MKNSCKSEEGAKLSFRTLRFLTFARAREAEKELDVVLCSFEQPDTDKE